MPIEAQQLSQKYGVTDAGGGGRERQRQAGDRQPATSPRSIPRSGRAADHRLQGGAAVHQRHPPALGGEEAEDPVHHRPRRARARRSGGARPLGRPAAPRARQLRSLGVGLAGEGRGAAGHRSAGDRRPDGQLRPAGARRPLGLSQQRRADAGDARSDAEPGRRRGSSTPISRGGSPATGSRWGRTSWSIPRRSCRSSARRRSSSRATATIRSPRRSRGGTCRCWSASPARPAAGSAPGIKVTDLLRTSAKGWGETDLAHLHKVSRDAGDVAGSGGGRGGGRERADRARQAGDAAGRLRRLRLRHQSAPPGQRGQRPAAVQRAQLAGRARGAARHPAEEDRAGAADADAATRSARSTCWRRSCPSWRWCWAGCVFFRRRRR